MDYKDLSKVYMTPLELQEKEKNMVTFNKRVHVSPSVQKFLKP
jgi:hypothetical protein